MQPIIMKALIRLRWKLNKIIDTEGVMPSGMNPTVWEDLQAMRATEAAQQRSAHMRSISQGKGSSNQQMKAIERDVVARLVSEL